MKLLALLAAFWVAFPGGLDPGPDPWQGGGGYGSDQSAFRESSPKIPTEPPTFYDVSATEGETKINLYCTTSRAARVKFHWVRHINASPTCGGGYDFPWVEGSYTTATGTTHGKQIGILAHTACYRVQIYIDAVLGPDQDWVLFDGDGETGDYETLVRDAGDPPDPEE